MSEIPRQPGRVEMSLPGIDDPLAAKLEWAFEHLKELDAQIALCKRSFRDGDAYTIVPEVDVDKGQEIHRLKLSRAIPTVAWGLMVSEIVHLARSALDNTIEGIGSRPNQHGVGFPFFTDRDEFFEGRLNSRTGRRNGRTSGRFMIRGIPDPARAIVEQLQPYHRGNDETAWGRSPLWVIHKLSNADKHRTPPVVAVAAFAPGVHFTSGLTRSATFNMRFPLEDGAEVLAVDLAPGQTEPNMKFKTEITLEIEFAQGPPAFSRPLIQSLDKCLFSVANTIKLLDPNLAAKIEAWVAAHSRPL